MRKAGTFTGIILIAAVFTGVWLFLDPRDVRAPDPRELQADHDLSGADPLAHERTLSPLSNGDPKRTSARGDSERDNATGEAPVPRGDEVGTGVVRASGEVAGRNGASATPDSAVDDATAAGETPEVRPFIKGHARPPGQNLGNTLPGARRVGKPAGVKQISDVTPKLMQDRRGLYAQYFRLRSSDITKIDTSSPVMVRIDQTIHFPNGEAFADLPISLDNFAATWEGFLVIPEAGDYWLFWGADNGGRIELDGETVLLQDGMVRYVEVSTVLTLEPGLHPLKIEFAQTHNNVADWAKCAANFMYVPEGQTKPIPVPPEMLMVPEWMWSDNAPIITKLSKTEGEVGDEITINGQGLGEPELKSKSEKLSKTRYITSVRFAGQEADILSLSDSSIRVKVPIGAQTGDLIVLKTEYVGDIQTLGGDLFAHPWIPSNSVEFTVNTQFGLMAQWYDLAGWTNFGIEVFDSGGLGDPHVSRIEVDAGEAGPPSDITTCAVVWTGKLGLPKAPPGVPGPETDDQPWSFELYFYSHQQAAVTVGGQRVSAEPVEIHTEGEPAESQTRYMCRVVVEVGAEHYLPLRIELVSPQGAVPIWGLSGWWKTPYNGKVTTRSLTGSCLFPPVVPPKPPVISDVKPVWAEGEQPAVPPYDADTSRPSVKVGQEFTFTILDFGPPEIWDTQPTVTIDGVPLSYTSNDDPILKPANRVLFCRATMPDGVGKGRMVARLSIVNSEPFMIDIANRGLVAYLYDVPDSSGLNELPDLGPSACFKVRKDRSINFEDTTDFDLPFPAETFVIEWLGGLIIEEEGDYEFICRSDDGMKLWLDDNVVIDANHRQAPAENRATVHLVPGTYRFRMQFFENNQHEVCVLEWRATRGEGDSQAEVIPRQVVPAKAFSLDVHPPFPAKISTGKRTDGS